MSATPFPCDLCGQFHASRAEALTCCTERLEPDDQQGADGRGGDAEQFECVVEAEEVLRDE